MSKIITWSTPKYAASRAAHESDSLLYADDIIRHRKFTSPFSIKFSIADGLRYIVDNQRITVPPGGFYLVNDGAEMECLPNNPGVKALFVFFTHDLIHDVHRGAGRDDKALLDAPQSTATPVRFFEHVYRHPNRLSGRLQALARHVAASEESEHHHLPDLFFQLAEDLLLLQQDTARQIGRVNARTAPTREELFRRVLGAREFMHDQWAADLTLGEVARRACLSPYHFHRTFREAFGQSPMRWFRRLKLEKARELLRDPAATATQVAFACGFADVCSFSKAFKRAWGVSPSAV